MRLRYIALAGAMSFAFIDAQAALFDRGGGLTYDSDLNVTWLQDANYAKTSGYDRDGLMNWWSAMDWAANLSFYDSVRNITYNDWRLPIVKPLNGAYFTGFSTNGTTDFGYKITRKDSEISHLYYVDGLQFFHNIEPEYGYFTGTELFPGSNDVLEFSMNNRMTIGNQSFGGGAQGVGGKHYGALVMVLRDGDVASVAAPVPVPIPEPETYAMMLAGLGLLGVITRRRKQVQA